MSSDICEIKYKKSYWDCKHIIKKDQKLNFESEKEQNIKFMEELVEEISKNVNSPITYYCDIDGRDRSELIELTWYIRLCDLFHNQEDWELLSMFYDNELCKINFPNTYVSSYRGYYFYTDPNGEYESYGKKWSIVPLIELTKFNKVSFDNMKFEIVEPYTMWNYNSLETPINCGSHGRMYSYHDQKECNSIYPFGFNISNGTFDKKLKLQAWRDRIVSGISDAYKICKETLVQIKPFATDLKNSVDLQHKCIDNIVRKMKIILDN